MTASEIAASQDPKVVMGIKRIVIEKCSHRSETWHRGLQCSGWHGRPGPLPPEDHPTLGKVVEDSASGALEAYQWPRRGRFGRPWLLFPAVDVARFKHAERPYLQGATTARLSADDAPVGMPGEDQWHFAETARFPAQQDRTPRLGITAEEAEAILGPRCPSCLYTRGNHRRDCALNPSAPRG
jgi:hypothetical protein